jgi:hypothetical protein
MNVLEKLQFIKEPIEDMIIGNFKYHKGRWELQKKKNIDIQNKKENQYVEIKKLLYLQIVFDVIIVILSISILFIKLF